MQATHATSLGQAHVLEFFLKEDAIFFKITSCIPFIGAVSSFFLNRSLTKQTATCNDPKHLITLLKVKNHYRIISVPRSLIEVALLIASIYVYSIANGLAAIFATIWIGFLSWKAGCNASNSYHHHQLIQDYESAFKNPDFAIALKDPLGLSERIRKWFQM